MSLVRPSFSHAFLKRRRSCSAVSLPRLLTLIIRSQVLSNPALIKTFAGRTKRRPESRLSYPRSAFLQVAAQVAAPGVSYRYEHRHARPPDALRCDDPASPTPA